MCIYWEIKMLSESLLKTVRETLLLAYLLAPGGLLGSLAALGCCSTHHPSCAFIFAWRSTLCILYPNFLL